VLQETLDDFRVRCSASLPLHQLHGTLSHLACRLLLLLAYKAKPTFWPQWKAATLSLSTITFLRMPLALAAEAEGECALHRELASDLRLRYYLHYFDEPNLCMRVSFVFYPFCREQTPLHLFAAKNQVEICRLLLQSNADIEAKDWR
jgi:hypothetical protein